VASKGEAELGAVGHRVEEAPPCAVGLQRVHLDQGRPRGRRELEDELELVRVRHRQGGDEGEGDPGLAYGGEPRRHAREGALVPSHPLVRRGPPVERDGEDVHEVDQLRQAARGEEEPVGGHRGPHADLPRVTQERQQVRVEQRLPAGHRHDVVAQLTRVAHGTRQHR
jgi:hypothetical protein